jgi:hypothetical protein
MAKDLTGMVLGVVLMLMFYSPGDQFMFIRLAGALQPGMPRPRLRPQQLIMTPESAVIVAVLAVE